MNMRDMFLLVTDYVSRPERERWLFRHCCRWRVYRPLFWS